MPGLLFVTAPEADYKIINQALLDLHEWDNDFDSFLLMTDKEIINADDYETTSPSLTSLAKNKWSGATMEEIEKHCLRLSQKEEETHCGPLFLVLDSEGIRTKTFVLGHLPYEYHDLDDPETWKGRFEKVRLPWDDTYIMWCNLDIANMGFEEFTVEGQDGEGKGDEEGWFTHKQIGEAGDHLTDEGKEKRRKEEERLMEEGLV
ncbi:hypothetical protein E4T43_05560 [Aureobasidium subglaciale]|nr:hypothetical protein E4T43_05560 [Aureobasidium subglaciale]